MDDLQEDLTQLPEEELKERFMDEYEKLRKKYQIDFVIECRVNPVKVNIPR